MAELSKDFRPRTVDRLIRCRKTQRYFRDGDWTADVGEASVFEDEIEAVRACVEYDLSEVDLVLRPPGTRTALFATQLR